MISQLSQKMICQPQNLIHGSTGNPKTEKKYSSKEVDYRMSVFHHNYNKIMSQP